jgi:hypothetical protein
MWVKDDPKRGTFSRGGDKPKNAMEQRAALEHRLIGKAHENFMAPFKISEKTRARLAQMKTDFAQLKRKARTPKG